MTNALHVDVTQFVLEVLGPANLARCGTELPNKLEAALPVIQVIRTGGPNDGVVLDIPTIVLHAYAATSAGGQKAANTLLYQAFGVLQAARGQLVMVDEAPAVMTALRLLGGPFVAAYENQNVRHAVSTIQPRIKAV